MQMDKVSATMVRRRDYTLMNQLEIFREFPELMTERLHLRQINMVDRAAVFRIYSDKEVARYNATGICESISDAERIIARFQYDYQRQAAVRWGICRQDNDTVIGTAGFFELTHDGLFVDCASLNYSMARVFWKQGFATEAVQAILRFGFEEMGLHRVEASVMVDDHPSLDLLASFGFQREGILRERGFWQGTYHDFTALALLSNELTYNFD